MYNLNAVGKHFLGETKVDLKAHEMFEIPRNNEDDGNDGKRNRPRRRGFDVGSIL